MKISKLKIRNFRSIKSLDLELSETTVLVGPNNTGKSAILDAIRLVLTRRWGQRGTGFMEYDVFLDSPTSDPRKVGPVTIEIIIEEDSNDPWPDELISELDPVIQLDVKRNVRSITLRVVYLWEEEVGNFEPNWEFLNIAGQTLSAGRRIMNTNEFFSYLPTFHLGALRDASDEFSSRSQFWGRLLKAMKIPTQLEEEITKKLTALNDQLLDADPRLKKVAKTLDSLQSISASDNPGGVNLRMLPLDMWDMLSRAEIVAQNESSTPWLPLNRHGQGMQSLSVILLFKAFVEYALSEYYKPLASPVLTLEEPEAHLHPQAARVLWKEVMTLPGQKIIATHSPYFIQKTPIREIRWVKISKEGTSITYLPANFSAVIEWIPELKTIIDNSSGNLEHSGAGGVLTHHGEMPEKMYREIATLYGSHANKATILSNLKDLRDRSKLFVDDITLQDFEECAGRIRGEILFARKWILVEGQTEYAIMHALAESMGLSLDEKGISVIDFQNNGSPGLFASVARALGIPWFMVSDGDYQCANFKKELENKGFSSAEIAEHFTSLPDGDLEEQLLHDDFEKELRQIANEIGLAKASSCSMDDLKVFLKNNKTFYSRKLSSLIKSDSVVAKKVPIAFQKVITDLFKPV